MTKILKITTEEINQKVDGGRHKKSAWWNSIQAEG